MPDQTLASLTAAGTLDGTEIMYLVQGGADRKVTVAALQGSSTKSAISLTSKYSVKNYAPATDSDTDRGAALEAAMLEMESLGYIEGYDGYCFLSELLKHSNGKYYGFATYGGEYSQVGDVTPSSSGYDHFIGWTLGVAFSVDPASSYAVTVIHRFARSGETWNPHAPPVEGAAGLMYGIGYTGPTGRMMGSFFSLTTAGVYTNLRNQAVADGGKASGQMLFIGGALYGTFLAGGANGDSDSTGCIFKYTPGGAYSLLTSFDIDTVISGQNTTGSEPKAGLVTDATDLFGVCQRYGALVDFSAIADTTGVVTAAGHAMVVGDLFQWVVISGGNKVSVDGVDYFVISVIDANNFTYSSSPGGGLLAPVGSATSGKLATGDGTVFKITTAGVFTRLHTFRNNTYGRWPIGIEIDGSTLIITCRSGGANGLGSVFSITTGGASPTLRHSFARTTGCHPAAAMVVAGGNYFGVTSEGGLFNAGTVYKLTGGGGWVHSVLAHLDGLNGAEGWSKPVYNGSDTIVFTTIRGGANNGGAICSVLTAAAASTAPPTLRYSAPAGSCRAHLKVPPGVYGNLTPKLFAVDRFTVECSQQTVFRCGTNKWDQNVSMGASGVRNMFWVNKNYYMPANEVHWIGTEFDCNVANQNGGNVPCFGGLIMYGTGCSVDRILIRNWGGTNSEFIQGYIMWINTAGTNGRYLFGNHWLQGPGRNNQARNSVICDPYPGTKGSVSCFRIGGDNTNGANEGDGCGIEPAIINCEVRNTATFAAGYLWAFNLQGSVRGSCSNCRGYNMGPLGILYGQNNWFTDGLQITGLRGNNVGSGISFLFVNWSEMVQRNVQITDCVITATNQACFLGGYFPGLRINNNVFGSEVSRPLILTGSSSPKGVIISNNTLIDPAKLYAQISGCSYISHHNNDENNNPLDTSASSTALQCGDRSAMYQALTKVKEIRSRTIAAAAGSDWFASAAGFYGCTDGRLYLETSGTNDQSVRTLNNSLFPIGYPGIAESRIDWSRPFWFHTRMNLAATGANGTVRGICGDLCDAVAAPTAGPMTKKGIGWELINESLHIVALASDGGTVVDSGGIATIVKNAGAYITHDIVIRSDGLGGVTLILDGVPIATGITTGPTSQGTDYNLAIRYDVANSDATVVRAFIQRTVIGIE